MTGGPLDDHTQFLSKCMSERERKHTDKEGKRRKRKERSRFEKALDHPRLFRCGIISRVKYDQQSFCTLHESPRTRRKLISISPREKHMSVVQKCGDQ